MGAVVVVGTHWGDEAKGKFVDLLGQDADVVIRYSGGPNAGHTVIVGETTASMPPPAMAWAMAIQRAEAG